MENIDLKLIQSDQLVDKRVLEVYEYLKTYKDARERTEWIERRKKCWDTIENKMWEEGEEKEMRDQGQIPFVINKCVKGVQGSCAIVTDQKPELKFYPIGSGDLYVAELMKRAFDVVWTKNEGNDIVYDLEEEVNIGAHGFVSVKVDKSLNPFGTIIIEDEPPEDYYFDANSRKRDYSDTHIIKAKQRNRTYIKEHYPDLTDNDVYFSPFAKEDDEKSSGITGEDNYAVNIGEPDTIHPDTKAKQKIIWEIEAWIRRTFKEDWAFELDDRGEPKANKLNIEKGQKPEDVLQEGQHHWPRMVEKRVQRIIVGKALVSEIVNPEGEDADGNPVLTTIGLKGQRTRSAYAMSRTAYARDINREKNKRRIQAIHAASQLVNAPLYFWQGTKWSGNPGTPGSYATLSKNVPNPPGRVPSGAVDVMMLIRLEEKSDNEIDDVYDLQDVMKGKFPKGQENVSGRLVLALQDMGGMMSKPSLRRLESALIRLGKAVMALILKHWQWFMWDRLLEPDERMEFAPDGTKEAQEKIGLEDEDDEGKDEIYQKIAKKWADAIELLRPRDVNKPPGLGLIDIDVKIVAGSSMPTNRIAKGQMAIEYVKAGIYDPEAALEYVDDPMKDKVVVRLKQNAELLAQQEMMKKGR